MPLDIGYIGRVYPPGDPYVVGDEHIRAFAEAVGDPNPAYRDAAAARALGHPAMVAPPTFGIAIAWPEVRRRVVDDPSFGMDFSRVVHGDQRFVSARPIRAGDRLLATVVVEDVVVGARRASLRTRTDLATVAGEAVVSIVITLLVRPASQPAGPS
jgi:acyl dehydratase